MACTGGLTGILMIVLMISLAAPGGETKVAYPFVPFPPALPTSQNLPAICQSGGSRCRYPDSYFPPSGFSHDRRRGKAINRLESWYSLCCSGLIAQQQDQILCCARQAWVQALSLFCKEEHSTKTTAYECCGKKGAGRWSCFNSELPNPNYTPVPGCTAPAMPQEPGFNFNHNAC